MIKWNLNGFDPMILASAILGIGVMARAVIEIVAVNQRIGGSEWWAYMFVGFGIVGSLFIIVIAYQAISDLRK